MRNSTKFVNICAICAILAFSFLTVFAAPTISLSWYKNNGFGMGDDIGGQWTVTAVASSDTTRVEFYLDSNLQQNDTSAPFTWSFNTADYSLGAHTIKAVAYSIDGQTAMTQVERNFVEYSMNLFWVIIGIVVAALAISVVVAVYKIREKR